jgi:hypothetical protein
LALGITKRAVLKQIDKLKEHGRLSRVGPTKGGRWEIIVKGSLKTRAVFCFVGCVWACFITRGITWCAFGLVWIAFAVVLNSVPGQHYLVR